MEVISIINQKGGVAKTTTAHALSTGLAILHNKKVLAIDIDPQGNLSSILKAEGTRGVLEVFKKEPIKTCIQETYLENLDLLKSSVELNSIDTLLANDIGKNQRLKQALTKIKKDYDYCIIDTPPNLSTLTVNALVSSDRVIITSQADLLSIHGIYQLAETIDGIREFNLNKKLKIDGILITRYQSRTNLSKQIRTELELVANDLKTKVYNTEITESTVHRENIALNQSIFEYKPTHKGAKEYQAFIREVIA